jgi:hypothetical protein
MKYMLLIYDDEKIWATMPEAERQKMFGEYMQFSKDVTESGHYKSEAPLQPTSKATSVKVRNGKRLVTDGPFAETRQLGGYYLVEAKDLTRRSASPRGFRRCGSGQSRCARSGIRRDVKSQIKSQIPGNGIERRRALELAHLGSWALRLEIVAFSSPRSNEEPVTAD